MAISWNGRARSAGKLTVYADATVTKGIWSGAIDSCIREFNQLAKAHGWGFFEKLRSNDMMLVQGNQQVADMVKRGERLIAVGADAAYVGESKKEGMPLSTLYQDDGTFIIPSPSSVVKGSPTPNAGKAFASFMLSKAVQELFPLEYLYSARTDIAGPVGYPLLSSIKMHAVDYDYIEAESTRIKRRFAEAVQ